MERINNGTFYDIGSGYNCRGKESIGGSCKAGAYEGRECEGGTCEGRECKGREWKEGSKEFALTKVTGHTIFIKPTWLKRIFGCP